MATSKAKRSVHPAQPTQAVRHAARRRVDAERRDAERRTQPRSSPEKTTHFPEARGRIVADVEFFADTSYNCFSIRFQDQTALCFEIETGFTFWAEFSRWKSGNQRILRRWPPIEA